jgi:hypothetical protein
MRFNSVKTLHGMHFNINSLIKHYEHPLGHYKSVTFIQMMKSDSYTNKVNSEIRNIITYKR